MDLHHTIGELSWREKGRVSFINNDYAAAVFAWEQALLCEQETIAKAALFCNLGIAYCKQQKWEIGASCYQQAVALCEEEQNLCVSGKSYMGLGHAYKQMNKLQLGISYAEKALGLFEQLGDSEMMEKVRANCGVMYGENGQVVEARQYLFAAMDAFQKMNRAEDAEAVFVELKRLNLE